MAMNAARDGRARIDDLEAHGPVDGGDGTAEVELPKDQLRTVLAMAERTASDPTVDPVTGAELGMKQV